MIKSHFNSEVYLIDGASAFNQHNRHAASFFYKNSDEFVAIFVVLANERHGQRTKN